MPNLDLEMFTSFSKLAKGGTLLFLHLVMKISRGLHFIFGPKALIIQNNDCTTTATRTTKHIKASNGSTIDDNIEILTSGERELKTILTKKTKEKVLLPVILPLINVSET